VLDGLNVAVKAGTPLRLMVGSSDIEQDQFFELAGHIFDLMHWPEFPRDQTRITEMMPMVLEDTRTVGNAVIRAFVGALGIPD